MIYPALMKILPLFTIMVFYCELWKQDGSIFVNHGLLKALLNLKGRNKSYPSHSLIPLTLPLTMLITRMTALSFTSSCKAFILWKKKLKLKSNVKATWRVLNEVLIRSKGKRGLPSIYRALRFSRNFQC